MGWLKPARITQVLAIAALVALGCEKEEVVGGPRVVCTTGMVADMVRNIAGEDVRLVQLMGEGVDPHVYKPSPGDIQELIAADIIFYSGLHLEGKLAEVFARLARRKPTIAVAEMIPKEKLLFVDGHHPDPHVWFDVGLWSRGIIAVRDGLCELDPSHAASYRERADAHQKTLAALDAECRADFASIPKEQRVLVTPHDAFGYLSRAYQIEVRSIQGISTDSEAGVKDVNELVDFMTTRKIPAVFIETTTSNRNIQSLIEGCRSRGHEVRIGGELYSDAMGAEGTPEGTYAGMVRHNVRAIVSALR